ncbi:uncharacterized protein Dwil_GK20654 [Drosophila willistoni]|uniref:Uncharacterized protein n=1 Tax=Drosophila willistoni TaxID=7260 RepID=B4MK90_DROWI|nr:uncharacterized protein Dwil_GK20654 [Drosophila willistoni]
MNYICVTLLIVLFLWLVEARPWWPHTQDTTYDASLDPLVWSRAFVQDTVRKSRTNHHHTKPHYGRRKILKNTWWQEPQDYMKRKHYRTGKNLSGRRRPSAHNEQVAEADLQRVTRGLGGFDFGGKFGGLGGGLGGLKGGFGGLGHGFGGGFGGLGHGFGGGLGSFKGLFNKF